MEKIIKHGIYYSEGTKRAYLPAIECPVDIRCPECGCIFTIDARHIDRGEHNTAAYCHNCECTFIPEESNIIKENEND